MILLEAVTDRLLVNHSLPVSRIETNCDRNFCYLHESRLVKDRIGLHSCTCLQGQLRWNKKVSVTKPVQSKSNISSSVTAFQGVYK
eukprot:1123785-Pelagomonas_calceolata.AAC.1